MSKSRLTEEEQELFDRLGKLADGYYELPDQHPADRKEFARAIHRCQEKILIRPERRGNDAVYSDGHRESN